MFTNLQINIVAFDNPYPPNYGGVIDVYYKIKALHQAGVVIHLHCFEYGRKRNQALAQFCATIHYYQRKPMWYGLFGNKPFIVQSRNSELLKQNLLLNNFPILFEGIHCCNFLSDGLFANRLKFVRMHNNEASYYFNLGKREVNIFKKIYFFVEFKRLKRYEGVLQHAQQILSIAVHEMEHYKQQFKQTIYCQPFHGNDDVTSIQGKGSFALYHGNLSVNENNEAALFLIKNCFCSFTFPLVIAGHSPSNELKNAIANCANVSLVENCSAQQLLQLMQSAQMHILPTFQKTGAKLKLINSLYHGRFVIVNSLMVEDTGLQQFCLIANTIEEFKNQITSAFHQEFTQEMVNDRQEIELLLSDKNAAASLIDLFQQFGQS